MSWPAIFLAPTRRASLSLRRLNHEPCAVKPYGMSCHDARTFIGTVEIIGSPEHWEIDVAEPAHTDPRWPKECQCGYRFTDEDYWQLNNHILYTRSDNGEELTLKETTVGMMWNAHWLKGTFRDFKGGPDGMFLIMKLPDGREWMIDGPSTNGPGWHREGTPPNLTVTPSILSTGYHGFLTAGVLTNDLDGRTYES